MDAKLIIVGGKANKSEIALRLPTIIGRSRDADLTMAHPMVSRQHCELYEDNGLLKIRDLGSLNGTFVGDEQVREADLYPDTEFTVGPLTFRVRYAYVGEIASAPPAGGVAADAQPAEIEPPLVEMAEDPLGFPETEPVPTERVDDQEQAAQQGDDDFAELIQQDVQPSQEPVLEAEPPVPDEAGPQAGIAPTDGELPDFAAWDAAQGGQPEPEEAAAPSMEEPLLAPPESSAGFEEESTAQFDALDLPPLSEPVPVEPQPMDEQPPIPAPPQAPAAPVSGAETDSTGRSEDELADNLPLPEGELADDLPLPEAERDEDRLTQSDDELNDFLKGLE